MSVSVEALALMKKQANRGPCGAKYSVCECIRDTQENVRLSNYLARRSLSREVGLIPLHLLLILG